MTKNDQKNGIIPYLFIIFFSIIFAVDIFFIYISHKTWRGVSTQDSYQKGLNYNETLTKVQKQKQLGWDLKGDYNQKTSIFTINLNDNSKKVIKNAQISAKFIRPIQEGYDFESKLFFNKTNYSYDTKNLNFPLKGQWKVEILAIKDKKVFQEVLKIFVE